MTHLPYIVASYALFVVVALALAITASLRLSRATRRLRAVDPRAGMKAGMKADMKAGGTTGVSES
jgi:hypothetical protein